MIGQWNDFSFFTGTWNNGMFAVDGLDEIQDIALDCIQVFKVNYR